MPCLSSPLSRVASALLAFLRSGHAHSLLSPHIDRMVRALSHREMRCFQIDSSSADVLAGAQNGCLCILYTTYGMQAYVTLAKCAGAPEVVGFVIGGRCVARPDSWRRLQESGHSVHHVRSVQLRACAILQLEAPAGDCKALSGSRNPIGQVHVGQPPGMQNPVRKGTRRDSDTWLHKVGRAPQVMPGEVRSPCHQARAYIDAQDNSNLAC